MMLISSRIGIFTAVLAMAIGQSGTTQAGLLPISNTVTPEGSNFNYSYGVELTSQSTLRTGDFFTIYDFQGFVPGSNSQPANFVFSSALVGPTPSGTAPVDAPTIANVTWTYTGPNIVVGDKGLGTFSVESQYGATTSGQFTSMTQRQVDGKPDANITETAVPVPTGVPEPTTLALMGIGLPFVGLFRLFRRKK